MTAAILAFATGVWWLQQQASLPALYAGAGWLWLCPPGAALLAAALRRKGQRVPAWVLRLLLWAVAFACGVLWATCIAQWRMNQRLAPALEGRDLAVTGVVASLPAIGERSVRFTFDIETAADASVRLPPRVLLSWYRSLPPGSGSAGVHSPHAEKIEAGGPDDRPGWLDDPARVHPGERWLFTVRLKRPHGNVNPHGFDYEAWLLERGIGATGYVRQRGVQRRLGERNSLADRIEQLREAVRTRFLGVLSESPTAGILVALAVGDQRAIGVEDWRLFSRTGVTHLMSISGLHVTLVSGLIAALVSFGWRRSPRLVLALPARKAAAAAAMLAAFGYTLLAGFGVPAQRTFFMVSAVALGLLAGRLSSPLRILALALLAVLLVDPWAVQAPGFWLSFGAVALIFYVTQGYTGSESWLVQWGRVQWAITVGLAPGALLLFGQVSLSGPLANALAIPLVSGLITPLTLASAVLPLEAPLQLADGLARGLMNFLRWCDHLPLALWQQAVPSAWSVLLALAGVAWLLAPFGNGLGRPARWTGALLFLPALLLPPGRPAPGDTWITTLDVGQGMSVLVRTAGHALLYDAGPTFGPETDSGERIIAPYLRAIGAARLDRMIVTHNDADHAGGAASVIAIAEVNELLSSLAPGHPIVGMVPDARRCTRGERWSWDGVGFELLHPAGGDYAERGGHGNKLSCVLRVSTAHGAMLLTGDIERAAEGALVAREGAKLRSAVLLAPHHGSRSSSSQALLDAVAPQFVVVTAGYRNRFGHPAPEVLARYAAQGAQVLRTDLQGAVTVRLGAGGVSAQAQRAVRSRYWLAGS